MLLLLLCEKHPNYSVIDNFGAAGVPASANILLWVRAPSNIHECGEGVLEELALPVLKFPAMPAEKLLRIRSVNRHNKLRQDVKERRDAFKHARRWLEAPICERLESSVQPSAA